MDRILFGDNQFFGINHMSEAKAGSQAEQFRYGDAIMKVVDVAYDAGIPTFMCTTHDRIADICDRVRARPDRYRDFRFYPCMPYAYKYADSVTQVGTVGTVRRFLPTEGGGLGGLVRTLLKGAYAAVTQDAVALMQMLVDAELKMFSGLRTPVIFLQNVITDMILGLGMVDMLAHFSEHVQRRHGAEAGFITMNLPVLVDRLTAVGITNPIVCASINKIGFRMCGGIELYEKTLRDGGFRAIAMSVFASGAIPPRQAIEYVGRLPNVSSILFGASSKAHIEETRDLINSVMQSDSGDPR